MSLVSGLNVASSGLKVIESKISVTSDNITQANTVGYTQKTYNADYQNTGNSTIAVGGAVQGSINEFLAKSLANQSSDTQAKNTTSTYLSSYDSAIGNTSKDGASLAGSVNDFLSSLSSVSGTGDLSSAKSQVVSTAGALAAQLTSASSNVQALRLQANQEIGTGVQSVNDTLDQIKSFNDQIAKSTTDDESLANLQDQRSAALNTLSGELGIQYFYDSNNQVQIYTDSGSQLLGSKANHLSYTAASAVSVGTVYPGGFSAVSVGGQDITGSIKTGKIGALITLRDSTLTAEQSKLDALANSLKTSTNTVLNTGASLPPRNSLTGTTLTAVTDAFAGTGTVRVAVTDSSGTVQSFADLNLASYPTVGAVVTALNGIPGVAASITADGVLQVNATNSANGVSLGESTSAVGAGSTGFSNYFGLNNLFDGTNGASDIKVSAYLQQSPGALAIGTLSNSATLAVGDNGIAPGDDSVAAALSTALNGTIGFALAGNFSAQQNTLAGYVNAVVAGIATTTNSAKTAAATSNSILLTLNSTISNQTGVNVDQETANTTLLQNSYSATAELISTIRSMFQSFISAIQ